MAEELQSSKLPCLRYCPQACVIRYSKTTATARPYRQQGVTLHALWSTGLHDVRDIAKDGSTRPTGVCQRCTLDLLTNMIGSVSATLLWKEYTSRPLCLVSKQVFQKDQSQENKMCVAPERLRRQTRNNRARLQRTLARQCAQRTSNNATNARASCNACQAQRIKARVGNFV